VGTIPRFFFVMGFTVRDEHEIPDYAHVSDNSVSRLCGLCRFLVLTVC